MKKLILLMCSLALLGGMAFATGGQDRKAAQKTVFTVALSGDIVALDPAFTWDFTTNPVVNQIAEGLVTFDTASLKVIPQPASRRKMTDDTTCVYQVRNDIIFSRERIRNPDTGSYPEWMYEKVSNISQTGSWALPMQNVQPAH